MCAQIYFTFLRFFRAQFILSRVILENAKIAKRTLGA